MDDKRFDFMLCNWDKRYYQIVIRGNDYFRILSPNLIIEWLENHNEILEELENE